MPLPTRVAPIELGPSLYQRVENDDIRKACELRELCEALAFFFHASSRHADKNRTLALVESMVLAAFFREFFLEMGDELDEVEVDLTGECFWHELPRLGTVVPGRCRREMGGPHDPGKSVVERFDGGHRVEPKKREIREIVPGQRLLRKMRVQTAKAAKATFGDPEAFQIGEDDLLGATNNDPLDLTFPVHENTDLAADLPRDFREPARKFLRDELSRRQPALEELFELLFLPGFQARDISFEFMNR